MGTVHWLAAYRSPLDRLRTAADGFVALSMSRLSDNYSQNVCINTAVTTRLETFGSNINIPINTRHTPE